MNATPRPAIAPFEALDASRLRDARLARQAGRTVVGLIGAVVPHELVEAAGCFPLGLMARSGDWARSHPDIEDGHEPEVRSLFIQAVEGEFELCDLIVIPSSSDGYRYLYQYLKEMQRQGRGERVPPLLLFDLLFGPALAVRSYSRAAFAALAERLSMLSGLQVDDDALRAALQTGNGVREALGALQALRHAGHVDGSVAHRAIRALACTGVAAYQPALSDWLRSTEPAAAAPARPRVLLVSAVPLHHEALHAAVEATGGVVTAEDDDWGARRAAPLIAAGTDPLQALFEHTMQHAISPRMLQAEREAWVRAQMHAGRFDAVLFYVPPSDQFFGWRYPALRALADSCGLPSLLLRDDVLDSGVDARPALTAFLGGLDAAPEAR